MREHLNKKSVKELKQILREYKKIHCQPYSKLKKNELVDMIIRHKIVPVDAPSKPQEEPAQKPRTKIKATKPKTTMKEYEPPNKNLKKALDPIIGGDQKMKFERLKIMYSCIIQKGGTSEQREQAKKIIEQFENDIKFRKSLFTNHVKFFNFYNVFKVELKKIIKMKDGPRRNMEERNIMGIFWEPGHSANLEDADSYHIGGEGKHRH